MGHPRTEFGEVIPGFFLASEDLEAVEICRFQCSEGEAWIPLDRQAARIAIDQAVNGAEVPQRGGFDEAFEGVFRIIGLGLPLKKQIADRVQGVGVIIEERAMVMLQSEFGIADREFGAIAINVAQSQRSLQIKMQGIKQTLLMSLQKQLERHNRDLKETMVNLDNVLQKQKTSRETAFICLTERLEAYSPLKTMQRGYSISSQKGKVIRTLTDVNLNEEMTIQYVDGKLNVQPLRKENKHD